MRSFKPLAIFAALALMLVGTGSALAEVPADSDSEDFSLVILAGEMFSVEITASGEWAQQPYSLTGPANFTNSTYYNMEVIDLRGTGGGWSVTAQASPFSNGLTTGQVQNTNNTQWSGLCGSPTVGFCAGAGSFSNGVSSYLSSLNISTGAQVLLTSTSGTNTNLQPNGTGTFTQQSAIYYTGVPAGIAVGTYTTTITLTLSGAQP